MLGEFLGRLSTGYLGSREHCPAPAIDGNKTEAHACYYIGNR